MIIYRCKETNAELFTDGFKITEVCDGLFLRVEGKMINKTEQLDEALFGANASAEEACEGFDATSISGIDIVIAYNLKETFMSRKELTGCMKSYAKKLEGALKEKDPDNLKAVKERCQSEVLKILKNFEDYQFYAGEASNGEPSKAVGMLNFCEDGITPYMLFFKDSLEIEKC